MYSIEDLDGVEYIGLEMKFNDKNTTVLCEVSLLTAWGIREWIDFDKREDDGCIIEGDRELVNGEESYRKVSIQIIVCDLRCADDGDFGESEPLTEGYASWNGARIYKLEGNLELWELTIELLKVGLVVVVTVGIVWRFRRRIR